MGIENGAAIEKKLENIDYFFERGIRYITLTHGKDNAICDSSYDSTKTWNGLSPFGRKVISKMNSDINQFNYINIKLHINTTINQ